MLNARSPLYKTLVGAKLGFYITGYRVFNFRFHSLTWVDFTKFINQVQLSLFSSCLFRQSYFMQGTQSAPCNPMELHNCLSHNSNKCNPLGVHILTKLNPSSLNSCCALKQTAAWRCFISGFPDGRSLGERKTGACKPKGRQAECFEREGNPRQW